MDNLIIKNFGFIVDFETNSNDINKYFNNNNFDLYYNDIFDFIFEYNKNVIKSQNITNDILYFINNNGDASIKFFVNNDTLFLKGYNNKEKGIKIN